MLLYKKQVDEERLSADLAYAKELRISEQAEKRKMTKTIYKPKKGSKKKSLSRFPHRQASVVAKKKRNFW